MFMNIVRMILGGQLFLSIDDVKKVSDCSVPLLLLDMDSMAQTRLHSIWPTRPRTRQLAEQDAKRIESESFTTVNQHFRKDPLDDGSAVKIYADHSHELMLKILKTGPKSKEEQEAVSEPVTADENTFFDISGGNEHIIETYEAAEELLKPLQKPGNKYTKIRFSNTSFGLDAARAAAPILSSLKDQLTDLNLSHNPLGEKGVKAFVELLKSQGNLEELCISVEAAKEVCELL
ncbi:Ran GTPase-activating protein 1, partial [Tanacetum coccineum]